MKYQVLFSVKNNEKLFTNVVCCSCDWCFKGKLFASIFNWSQLETFGCLNIYINMSD